VKALPVLRFSIGRALLLGAWARRDLEHDAHRGTPFMSSSSTGLRQPDASGATNRYSLLEPDGPDPPRVVLEPFRVTGRFEGPSA
jgi:hypothetical protein